MNNAEPESVRGKLAQLETLVSELAHEDWAGLPTAVQDEAIRVLEKAEASQAAIRGATLAAFDSGPGLAWYGQQSLVSFLVAETKVTRPAARIHQGWAKRHRRHPQIMTALACQQITVPIAIKICGWSDQLPDEHQDAADEILLTAWLGGCGMGDLAMLARQMFEELDPDHDDGKPPTPGVTVGTTLDGAGVLNGDLSPGVTALVKAAFAKYAEKLGPDDKRTLAERQHAALGEICRQILSLHGQAMRETQQDETQHDETQNDDGLFAAPEPEAGTAKNGTGHRMRPITALVHIPLAQLLDLPYTSKLAGQWTRKSGIDWAAENARAAEEPGIGGAWLTGQEALDFTVGATITPVVTACPDTSVIGKLAAAGARLHQLLEGEQHGAASDPHDKHGLAADLLGWAIKALSGPGGFASYLRTRLFAGTVLGSGSLVLDVGRSREIPRQLRIAVALRDRSCAKPGCDRPGQWTQPHHVQHYAHGGLTNPENLKQYCGHDHHILIHREGWDGSMHPDGTVDLYRPDGSRYTPGTRYEPEQRE